MKMVEKSYRVNGNDAYSVRHGNSNLEMFSLTFSVRVNEITVRIGMNTASDNRIPKVVGQFVGDNFDIITEYESHVVSFISYDSMTEVMKKIVEMSIRVEDVFGVYLDELNYKRNIERENELKEKHITEDSMKVLHNIIDIINSLT